MGHFNLSLIRSGRKKADGSKPDRNRFRSGAPNISAAGVALGCIVISGSLIGMLTSSHSQTPADDVAAQVRSQGYQCDPAVTAERDVGLSKPNSTVWTLKCGNATYRVTLVPDMSAHVVKLNR
jgi:hypothetical protein